MVKELSTYFVGRGEVKGMEFTQIHKTDHAYMYECVNNGQIHYEVFKRKENKHFNTVSYPSSKAFGLWAWTFANILDAQAKLELINKAMEKVIKVYINASMSQLSIARHSGGAIVNGKKYIWDYANDSLVLKSYKKEWAKIAEKKPLWR